MMSNWQNRLENDLQNLENTINAFLLAHPECLPKDNRSAAQFAVNVTSHISPLLQTIRIAMIDVTEESEEDQEL